MKTAIGLTIALALAVVMGRPAWGGDIAGTLGEIGENPAPDERDRPEKEGTGQPAGAQPPAPRPGPAPPADVKDKIQRVQDEIARLRKLGPYDLKPVNGVAEAERQVRELRQALDKTRADLTTADRKEAAALAQRKVEFDRKWKDLADAISSGRKPPDMTPLEWARQCDDYFWEKSGLDAEFADAKRRLEQKMDRRLADLERAVQQAEEHLEIIRRNREQMPEGTRRFMDRMMAYRLHKAALRAAERLLKDLLELQKDIDGAQAKRGDPIEAESIELTGFLLPDKLRLLVLRELSLSDATAFPARGDLDKGLKLPEWMTLYPGPEMRRAKHEYAQEQLRLANQSLRDQERDLQAEDEANLDFLRQLGLSQDELKAEEENLRRSRGERLGRQARELRDSIDYWKKQVALEAAELERLEQPTTRPD